MRRPLVLAAFAALAALTLGPSALGKGGAAAPGAPPPAAQADPLVVHEWGTFTSVQGADGVGLEGLQHEEETLPGFVYSRSKVRECPLRAQGFKGLEVPATHVTQKMETPVLYFHTKTPRRVRVRVDFVGGLITQWYPVSDLVGPPEGPCDGAPLDVSKVARSFLQWDVDLTPRSATPPAEIPSVAADDPWALARKVDAAWVRTVPRKRPERSGPVEAEQYLFYRGLGSFRLPVRAEVTDDGEVSFVNAGKHAVPHLAAFEVSEGGRTGRWGWAHDVAPGATAADLLAGRPLVPWRGDGDGGAKEMRIFLRKVLRSQGMNEDEAEAMLATWSRSWFDAEGTRILYVVPRPLVDALLPLHVDPAPQSIERVLVGRIECIPPATLKEVEAAVAAIGSPEDAKALAAANARLERLGRFREPHLRRVLATTRSAQVRATAESLLAR
jgi:hypothetical protein